MAASAVAALAAAVLDAVFAAPGAETTLFAGSTYNGARNRRTKLTSSCMRRRKGHPSFPFVVFLSALLSVVMLHFVSTMRDGAGVGRRSSSR